ncbi:MAG: Endonuclease/Exonuclease/phosphatase family protein [Gemmatimonadetes bacterium]|nr:Endonuclease/Exonuclease/phosphatase family protein [Gemmatimonadota bacterium]
MEAAGPSPAASCRTAVRADGTPDAAAVAWTVSAGDRAALDRWCAAVGPAVVQARPAASASSTDRMDGDSIPVVTWNVHVGGGDLPAFVDSLRAGRLTDGVPVRDFVLLVQEAWRRDTLRIPTAPADSRSAHRIHETAPGGETVEIVDAARRLGLSLAYVPSMRNGAGVAEDRGNAILSTLPPADVRAVELPFENQRRVTVSATFGGAADADGCRAAVRLTSAHLDNQSRLSRILASLGPARTRQAKGLVRALATGSRASFDPAMLIEAGSASASTGSVGSAAPAVSFGRAESSESGASTVTTGSPGSTGSTASPFAVDLVGGDFNTWFGGWEGAVRAMRRAFPQSPRQTPGATHTTGAHLDYFFVRDASGRVPTNRRIASRFGSDHHPLLTWLRLPPRGACPGTPTPVPASGAVRAVPAA